MLTGLACVVSVLTGALVLGVVVEPRFRLDRVLIDRAGQLAVVGLVVLLMGAMWRGDPGLVGWAAVLGATLWWAFDRRRGALLRQLRESRVRLYRQRHAIRPR